MVVMTSKLGRLEGVDLGGAERYLNVPYAAPLRGGARFREAEPRRPWTGVRDATRPGPTSPQPEVDNPLHGRLASPGWIKGDDVLSVNVWTPGRAGAAPVAVWIYGGAFKEGNAALPLYDGTGFARNGVVLVTINYRVGVEGFLPVEGSVNRGLHDQVHALEWVRENIADFGGDPGRVTIFGQSAGGMSVASLVATPSARGLFHAAVNQSGPLGFPGAREEGEATARALAALCEVPLSAAGLARVEPERLLAAGVQLTGNAGAALTPAPYTLGVVAEPEFVPWHGTRARADRFASRVPLLAGFTSDEFGLFGWPDPELTDAEAVAAIEQRGIDGARALAAVRTAASSLAAGTVVRKLSEQSFFVSPILEWLADARAEGLDAWAYEFGWRTKAFDGVPGAYHNLDIPFVFDLLDAEAVVDMTGPQPPLALRDQVHGDWRTFFAEGALPRERYDGTFETVRRYGEETGASPTESFRALYLAHVRSAS
ncbi:MAG: carboxylesterase family protein [Microbacterium sp.]